MSFKRSIPHETCMDVYFSSPRPVFILDGKQNDDSVFRPSTRDISWIIEFIENTGLIYRSSRYFVQWKIVETMSTLRAHELSLPRIKVEDFFNFKVFYECPRNWTKTTFVSDDSRSIVERKDIQRKVERVEQIATDYSGISSNLIDETSV